MSRRSVEVVDHTGLVRDARAVVRLVEGVLGAEKTEGAVVVAFIDEKEMTELNGRYRGATGPTDVLSFPVDQSARWPGEEEELGEVVVCPQVVLRYGREEGTDFGQQLGWTLVHGTLHLLGYDHEADRGEMRRRERELLSELKPLVEGLACRDSDVQAGDSR
jgi:probable rRNA maturation factor